MDHTSNQFIQKIINPLISDENICCSLNHIATLQIYLYQICLPQIGNY